MEEEIDLKNVLKMFWDRKIGIIVIILISLVIGYVYTTFFVEPVYQATAEAVLTSNSANGDEASKLTQTEISMNNQLLSTYREIAKSDAVIDVVIKNLNLKLDGTKLKSQIDVTSKSNSQVIQITVTNTNASVAQQVANETRNVFIEKVTEIYGMKNIQPLTDAKLPSSPSNVNHKKDIIMFLAIGIVLAIAYVIVANMLDNTIKTAKDIEEATGLTVLAEIPLCDFTNGKGRRK